MKKILLFLAAALISVGAWAQATTYTMITSQNELSAGDKVLLVGYNDEGQAFVMSYQKTNNRHAIEINADGGTITTEVATSASSQTEPFELTIGGSTGAWTFFDELNNGYLYAPGGGNYLKTQSTLDNQGQWTLTMDGDGFVPTSNGGAEQNIMRYNVTSTLFGCYKSSSTVVGLVYIFKAGGAPVIYPEPSEYPTAFNGTADKTNVTLTWNSSAGAQLPRGYVIIGSTGSITLPVDGTPIVNDLNANDGHVAYNVMFGTTEYTFTQLLGNSTWTFAIFPYTNSGEDINYKNGGTYPAYSVTIADIYGIVSANFATDLAPFTAYNVTGDQDWYASSFGGTTFAKMSGYANGAANVNEDWLISPDLFANGKYHTLTISFRNAYRYDGDMLAVKISRDYDGMSDPNEFVWDDVTEFFNWSPGEFEWAESGEMEMEDIYGDHIYFAFVYTSSATAASTWEITDVEVYGTGWDVVSENEAVSFNLYPNPANSCINVVAASACELQIMDMTGRMVMTVNAVEGENTINVAELESGVYFVRMNGAVVKFVKR